MINIVYMLLDINSIKLSYCIFLCYNTSAWQILKIGNGENNGYSTER